MNGPLEFSSYCFSDNEKEIIDVYLDNLKDMKTKAASSSDLSQSDVSLIFDLNLPINAVNQKEKLIAVEKLFQLLKNETTTVGESLELWNEILDKIIVDDREMYDDVLLTEIACFSNMLNPKLKGKCFLTAKLAQLNFKFMKFLSNAEEFKLFNDYQKNRNIFAADYLEGHSSEVFWETLSCHTPNLSKVALACSSFPASTYISVQDQIKICDKNYLNEKYKFVNKSL